MKDWKKEMDLLYHLLEQEVAGYHQLIKEVKVEAKCLRGGDTESLIRSVKAIEDRIQTIRMIEEEVERIAETILNGLGKGEKDRALSCLQSLLPPAYQSRISSYQRTLSQLKAWTRQINDQNTAFIRESMGFLSELIPTLVGHRNGPMGYPGTKRPFTSSPYALNQEV